ncbi:MULTISPECIES: site-specific integrase [unclassified Pantoea]|uniref:tyrosine-type recombinase/integrase n=1 Tax=unclassified Pantoea TaxID=2630326 RepID=UPI0012320B46|nr:MULTISPECIES: site-specific integrase [unclassified Pantoea]KAA5974861.1 site-specific integrase [Pantoea sp. M_6]KAA5979216.1 site-specific integrase [Pantoea sp. M_8]KAA5992010.1 site-specific integrase [Pantoea sp. M_10]
MSKVVYPTGVENHGGTLRIWFVHEGKRRRESLGIPDNAKNRKLAGELRTAVNYRIKTGTFDYQEQFPNSKHNSQHTSSNRGKNTISEVCDKFMELKRPTISAITFKNLKARLKTVCILLGADKPLEEIMHEDILALRGELLNGRQFSRHGHDSAKQGRKVTTVNSSISHLKEVLTFAVKNGYISRSPADGIYQMKKDKTNPDPLTRDEFLRLIDAASHQQIRNFWSLAVYTGMRHGELCALAWEDIDLSRGTITVCRNLTALGNFCMPKTTSGERTIELIDPAIQVLKSQRALTQMRRPVKIEVAGREYRKKESMEVTFVFSSEVTDVAGVGRDYYSVMSVNGMWRNLVRRSGIRLRKPYQTRHTYACWSLSAGANPSFIATQMGHSNAQMVYNVYGKWMKDNNSAQVALLNNKLNDFAPPMPQRNTAI